MTGFLEFSAYANSKSISKPKIIFIIFKIRLKSTIQKSWYGHQTDTACTVFITVKQMENAPQKNPTRKLRPTHPYVYKQQHANKQSDNVIFNIFVHVQRESCSIILMEVFQVKHKKCQRLNGLFWKFCATSKWCNVIGCVFRGTCTGILHSVINY